MSKREEDFIEAGIQYRFAHDTPMAIGSGHFAEMTKEMNRIKPFEAGCEYGYQYAVEKVCDILNHYCNRSGVHPSCRVDIINHICKAMEE